MEGFTLTATDGRPWRAAAAATPAVAFRQVARTRSLRNGNDPVTGCDASYLPPGLARAASFQNLTPGHGTDPPVTGRFVGPRQVATAVRRVEHSTARCEQLRIRSLLRAGDGMWRAASQAPEHVTLTDRSVAGRRRRRRYMHMARQVAFLLLLSSFICLLSASMLSTKCFMALVVL